MCIYVHLSLSLYIYIYIYYDRTSDSTCEALDITRVVDRLIEERPVVLTVLHTCVSRHTLNKYVKLIKQLSERSLVPPST